MASEKRVYVLGIFIAIISMVMTFFMVGIPFGTGVMQIICVALFAICIIINLVFGLNTKVKDMFFFILSFLITAVLFAVVAYSESKLSHSDMLMIGALPAASLALAGVIRSSKLKEKKNTKASMILNLIALFIALAACVIVPFYMGGIITAMDL